MAQEEVSSILHTPLNDEVWNTALSQFYHLIFICVLEVPVGMRSYGQVPYNRAATLRRRETKRMRMRRSLCSVHRTICQSI